MTLPTPQAACRTQRLIPIHQVAPGLYWITQHSPKKGVEHHAILDVGNCMGYPDVDPRRPLIIHQTPPAITREPFEGTGQWKLVRTINEERDAIRRFIQACAHPIYNPTGNNCEHFARYQT